MRKLLTALALGGGMLCAGAVAQEFPSRQIRIVVPFPASAVGRLNAEIVKILNTTEQFAALLKSDGARYTKIARAANIRLH